MSEWSVCPHCGLKHRPRPDGRCPRCHKAVVEEGPAPPETAMPMPDVYDGRVVGHPHREVRPDPAPSSSARSRLGGIFWGVLVLVAIGFLVRQRGEIVGVIRETAGLMREEPIVLEVLEFECERVGPDIRVAGAVKNHLDEPLSLSVNLRLQEDGRVEARRIKTGQRVDPYPLPTGRTGRFDFNLPWGGPVGFGSGVCWLHSFDDDKRGEAMNYTGRLAVKARDGQ